MKKTIAQPEYRVEAVDKALAILSAFTVAEPRLTQRQLADRTGLNQPTIYRTAGSLVRAGFLVRGEDGRFRLGSMLLKLGAVYEAAFDLGELIKPALARIVAETGETANFYVREGNERVCLFRHDGPDVWHTVRVGTRLPLDKGSPGRVILAFEGEPGEPYETIRANGVFHTPGDRDPLGAGASSPVFGADGKVVGALTVLGFRPRVEHKVHTVFTEVVMRYAEYLTRQLGGIWPFPELSAKAGE
ncbi:MAG TPA: IclR family transcriptional regulator [Stellaceae bacterium]|jgi:DNA-binding IclR family transcriptional regulator